MAAAPSDTLLSSVLRDSAGPADATLPDALPVGRRSSARDVVGWGAVPGLCACPVAAAGRYLSVTAISTSPPRAFGSAAVCADSAWPSRVAAGRFAPPGPMPVWDRSRAA